MRHRSSSSTSARRDLYEKGALRARLMRDNRLKILVQLFRGMVTAGVDVTSRSRIVIIDDAHNMDPDRCVAVYNYTT
jgi:hypothetical protein